MAVQLTVTTNVSTINLSVQKYTPAPFPDDAPSDGNIYGRKDAEWVEVGDGGIPTERITFSPIIKADKKYFTTDTNRHTQTADINFTFDDTDAVIDGGCIIEIVGSGDKAIFTTDFGAINSSLILTYNYVTLIEDTVYKFIFYWTGEKVNVMIGEVNDIEMPPPPALNVPIISASEWDDSTTATITLTDTNTSPNEVETEVEWSIAGADSWALGDTVAQDGTTATITGLDDENSYDFRAKAIGNSTDFTDSEYSEIQTLLSNTPVILMSDDFSGGTIDLSKWTVVTATNGETTQASGVLSLSATGNTSGDRFGLTGLVGYSSSNDLLIIQTKLTVADNIYLAPLFGFSKFPFDATEFAAFVKRTSSPYNQLRILVKDNNVNEINTNTSVNSGIDYRIKYVPSTGAIDFEYWNGSAWISLGTGNIDLGTTVSVNLLANIDEAATGVVFDNFFISGGDYITQYPS